MARRTIVVSSCAPNAIELVLAMADAQGSKEHQKGMSIVREVINRIDPMELSPGKPDGTPVNEYDQEVGIITNYLVSHADELKEDAAPFAEEINDIWQEYFGEECNSPEKLAKEILTKYFQGA